MWEQGNLNSIARKLDKLPPIWSETENSNSNHSGNYEFNSILLLSEIDPENWTVKVHGAEEDVNNGKDNKKGVNKKQTNKMPKLYQDVLFGKWKWK